MLIDPKDYVIVKESNGNKSSTDLFQVTKINKSNFTMKRVSEVQALEGFHSQEYYLNDDDLGVEILACLGPSLPKTNYNILGQRMMALTDRFFVKDWSNVYWFLPTSDGSNGALQDEVQDILSKCAKELKSMNCLELFPFQTHVAERFYGNKHLGTYTKFGRYPFDVIHFYITPSADNGGLNPEVIYHEYAHGIWHYCLPKSIKVKWYNYYIKSCEARLVSEKHMLSIAKDLAAAESIKAFKQANKDDEAVIKAVAGFLKIARSYHNLTQHDLDIMLEEGEDIYPLLIKNDRSPIGGTIHIDTKITDYANKNAVEMFCEAFSLMCVNKPLPKEIDSLLDITLDSIEPRQMNDD